MQTSSPSTFRFQKSADHAHVQVLNEHAYVMGQYSLRTGLIRWHRVVAQPQRLRIEEKLRAEYPLVGS